MEGQQDSFQKETRESHYDHPGFFEDIEFLISLSRENLKPAPQQIWLP